MLLSAMANEKSPVTEKEQAIPKWMKQYWDFDGKLSAHPFRGAKARAILVVPPLLTDDMKKTA